MKLFLYLSLITICLSCSSRRSSSALYPADISYIEYHGGDGSSMDSAVIIKKAKGSFDGIEAEYAFINKIYGRQNVGWQLKQQSLLHQNGKSYDQIDFKVINTGKETTIYFDITAFFGKY